MGNNNEAKITIVGDAEQLRGLIKVVNTDLADMGKVATVDPFKPLVASAQNAAAQIKTEAQRIKADIAALDFTRVPTETGLALKANIEKGRADREALLIERRATQKQLDQVAAKSGASNTAQGTLQGLKALKEETKGLGDEAQKSHGFLAALEHHLVGTRALVGGLITGIVGGEAIGKAIEFLKELADEQLEIYKRSLESQEKLDRASRDTGLSLNDQAFAVNRLSDAYKSFSESAVKDLIAVTLELGKLPDNEDSLRKRLGLEALNPHGDLQKEIENRAKKTADTALTQSLSSLSDVELAKMEASLAVQRGIHGERSTLQTVVGGTDPIKDEEARKKAVEDFLSGKDTTTLSGRSDEEIQRSFAIAIGKLVSQLTPEEIVLARRNELVRQTSGLGSSGTLNNQLEIDAVNAQLKRDFGAQQFQKVGDDARQHFAEDRAAEAAQLAQQTEKARAIFKDVKSEFNDLAQRIGQGNPFVKFAIDSAQSIEDIKTKFQGFGSDFVAMMLKIEAQTRATELAQLRYNSSLTALKDNQEARRLDQAFIGITGPQTRDLAVVNAQLADLTQGGAFRDRADRLARPFAARPDARREFDRQLRDLLGIDTSGAGRFGREAVSDAVLNLTGKIDPRTLATSGDPVIRAAREAAITANRTKAASFTANLQDEIARRDAGQSIVKDAVEQLNLLQNSGLDRRAGIKEFLATTGALSESELTPDLRRARANALRESAKLESGREDEGFKLQQQQAKDLAAIKKVLLGAGIKIDPDSVISLNIDLSDGDVEKSHKPSLPQAPKADVTHGGPPANVPFQQY